MQLPSSITLSTPPGGGGGGGVSGSGTTNFIPLWTGSTALGNSIISAADMGHQLFVGPRPSSPAQAATLTVGNTPDGVEQNAAALLVDVTVSNADGLYAQANDSSIINANLIVSNASDGGSGCLALLLFASADRAHMNMSPVASPPTNPQVGDLCITTEPHFYVCLVAGVWIPII